MTIFYTPSNDVPIVTNILLEKRVNDNHNDIEQRHFVKFSILFLSMKTMLPIVNAHIL